MKYPIILMDADGTLLDFERSSREAFARTMPLYGAPGDDNARAVYTEIDGRYWAMLERGEIDKKRLLSQRFEDFFALFGLAPDCAEVSARYLDNIAGFGYLLDGAIELCEQLRAVGHMLFLVTNGTARAQKGRMVLTGLEPLFERAFISDEIGFQKPDARFFDTVFAALQGTDKSDMILLGDSLTSDMRGGRNAGVATCWYNPTGKTANADCDYVITRLDEFPAIVR